MITDITPNQYIWVLKRTAKKGPRMPDQGLVPENAVVKMHLSLYLVSQDERVNSSWLKGKAEKHRIEMVT